MDLSKMLSNRAVQSSGPATENQAEAGCRENSCQVSMFDSIKIESATLASFVIYHSYDVAHEVEVVVNSPK